MYEYFLLVIAILYLSYFALNRVFVTSPIFKVYYIIFSLFAISILLI